MKSIKTILLITYLCCAQIGNAQWVEQLFTGTTFSQVSFETPSKGWALSNNSTGGYYLTENGGKTWKKEKIYLASNTGQDVDFNDSQAGLYKISDSRYIFKSNGGIYIGSKLSIPLILKVPEAYELNVLKPEFIAYVSSNYMKISKDSAKTWSSYFVGSDFVRYYDIFFADTLTGYIVGENGNMRKSVNGGKVWRACNSGSDKTLRAMQFVSPTVGWIAGDGGYLAKTVNGGNSFTQQISGVNINFQDIEMRDSLIGYAVGSLGAAYRTVNGGRKWEKMETNTFETLYSISCPANDTCYAAGTGGSVIKYSGQVITANSESEKQNSYSLYPNPATDRINVGTSQFVNNLSITICNTLGVPVLATENIAPSSAIDIATLPAGLYTVGYIVDSNMLSRKQLVVK